MTYKVVNIGAPLLTFVLFPESSVTYILYLQQYRLLLVQRTQFVDCNKVSLSRYTPWRRLGGEEV